MNMKFFRCIPIMFLVLTSCQPRTPKTINAIEWLTDLDVAEAQAKKSNVPLLVEFSTEWCPYCKFVDERIFPQPVIAERLERFVRVRFDGDLAPTQPLMERFHVVGFPTFLVLASDGTELARFNDITSSQELIDLFDRAMADTPGFKELTLAKNLEDRGDEKAALENYRLAAKMLREKNDPALEKALKGWEGLVKDQKEERIQILEELVKRFPTSAWLPSYYQEFVDVYHSAALKKEYRRKAVNVIEDRLRHFSKLSQDMARITLSEHIVLLAELYGDVQRQDEIKPLYLRAAEKCQDLVEEQDGVDHSRHLIGDTVYYYRRAGEPKRAIKFLDHAVKTLPDYWPIASGYATSFADLGRYDRAAEWARRGYALAEEVAKPKMALTWAEIEAAAHHYAEAQAILVRAREDLEATGAADNGRAKEMMTKINAAIAEYKLVAF